MLLIKNKKIEAILVKIVDSLFKPMQIGQLEFHLPDGSNKHFGNPAFGLNVDIKVNNYDFFKKLILYGDIGFAESYIDGDWTTSNLKNLIDWLIINIENNPFLMEDKEKNKPISFLNFINQLQNILNKNTLRGSKKNIASHYDLGNNFFSLFLDQSMTYSSAYFTDDTQELFEAQQIKYDTLCKKIKLDSSDSILEIGSGWGGFSVYAAKHYGCKITTVTISENQYNHTKTLITKEGLENIIDVKLCDYRMLNGKYDKVVSIEMIEAVGHDFLDLYLSKCQSLLKKNGIFALQAILCPDHRYNSFRRNIDFIQKHIFPGSILPSFERIFNGLKKSGTLSLLDYEDISPSYAKTLSIWKHNFLNSKNEILKLGFDDKFIRKWEYYFSYCESAFNTRNISVAQIIFSRPNNLTLNPGLSLLNKDKYLPEKNLLNKNH